MEKLTQTLKKKYSLTRIYKDDLEEINEILLEHSTDITYTTSKFKYESLDEFLKHEENKKLYKLNIQSNPLSFYIDLSPQESEIRSYKNDTIHQGIFSRINDILKSKQPKLSFLSSYALMMIFTCVYLILTWGFKVHFPIYISAVIICFYIILLIGFWLNIKRHSIIKVFNKENEKNFWNRNWEQIVVQTIMLILGGIIGYTIAIMTK